MTSLALSLFLSACGNIDSTANAPSGIQDAGANLISKAKAESAELYTKAALRGSGAPRIPRGKSPNGFHPAPIDKELLSKARSKYKKRDKHGMPTYSADARHRVVRTTAYSHMENEVGAPGRKNAIGTNLKYGQVRSAAADWSVLPVGTKFKVKGLPHTYIVDDYGSALVGTNTVDIYHPTLRGMRRWGTRKAEIVVTQWGDWDRTLKILKGRTRYKHTRKMYYAAKAKVQAGKVAMQ